MRESPELSDTQRIKVGDIVADRYEFVEKLGEGGMGAVFKARDQLLIRTVAVKIVALSGFGISQDEIVRFQREARSASNINHPNVIKVLDFGVMDRGQPYMVMEYVPGISVLDSIRKQGPHPVKDSLWLIEQICDGMSAVHKEGIVHRDLKSSNLVIVEPDSSSPTVKILDFGIAKSVISHEETLTQAGQALGSPLYMSPEQACGDSVDERTDVYSLGCIAYELLTGRPPFKGNNPLEIISQHLNSPPPTLSQCNPDLSYPTGVEELVARAVAKDPEERFQSMAQMKERLQEISTLLTHEPDGELELNVPTKPSRIRTRTAFALIGSVTALLISIFAALYLVGANTTILDGVFGITNLSKKVEKIKIPEAHHNVHDNPYRMRSRHETKGKGILNPKLDRAIEAAHTSQEVKESSKVNIGFELLNQTQQMGSNAGAIMCMNDKGLSLLDSYAKEKQTVYVVYLIKCTVDEDLLRRIKAIEPEDLKLKDCNCGDQELKIISGMRSIKLLTLDGKNHFTKEGLKHLSKLQLQYLAIRDGNLGNEEAQVIATYPKLMATCLANNRRITSKGLGYFLAVKRPISLNVDGCTCAFVPSGTLEALGKKHHKFIEHSSSKQSSEDVADFCHGMGWEVPSEVF